MSVCNFSYFPFWFRGQDLVSDCPSFWSLLVVFTKIVQATFQWNTVYNAIGHLFQKDHMLMFQTKMFPVSRYWSPIIKIALILE